MSKTIGELLRSFVDFFLMGQNSSTVTSGIKNQVDNDSNAMYQLGSLSATGELADLAKTIVKSGEVEILDEEIKKKVRPFLYNDGDGMMMSIEEVISVRHKERTGNAYNQEGSHLKKFVCWRLDSRGAVGETLLHVCFLTGLPPHMKLLAQRLVYNFPKIINDFYICDEYYGETALHMGIVNEDPEIVRFLLKSGSAVDQRCTGKFFTADDQKDSRVDSPDSEHCLLNKHTTYSGHLYWGEYPLSFAAVLKQHECFRMLCAHGADPNWQDCNGNTVLHICTIHELWEMFELALSLGAKLHVLNRQGLTPLTLAAYLAKKQMFEYIVKEERQVYWTYGDIMCAAYPLEHLDSIEPSTGKINRNSTLAIVVYGNSSEHLNLLPNLLEELVHKKWTTYGRKALFKQLGLYVVYFILMFACFLIRPTPFEREANGISLFCLLKPSNVNMTPKFKTYSFLNFLVVIGATLYLLQMYKHIKNVGKAMYFLSLSGFPAKAIFLVSCVLVEVSFFFRMICWDTFEDILWIITILLTAVKFLFYCRGFKSVGPFVLMLYKIIQRDLSRFFIIYSIIVIGFSQAFYIIFLGYRRGDPNFNIKEEGTIMYNIPESFIRMFLMSLTEFTVFYQQLGECRLATIGKITFIIYMLLVTMLLINMLIAMMTNTYTDISANSLEWLRQWSAIIMMMEQSFDSVTRLKYQRAYSIPMEDGKRIALLLKTRIPDDEMEIQKKKMQQSRNKFLEEKRRNYREIVSSRHAMIPPSMRVRPRTLQNGREKSRERSNTFGSVMNGKAHHK